MTFLYKQASQYESAVDMKKCRASVASSYGWRSHQCNRKRKVTRDGVGYCTQHDPERKAAVAKSQEVGSRLQMAVMIAKGEVTRAERALVEEAIGGAATGSWNMDFIRDKAHRALKARKARDAAQEKYNNHTTGGTR